MRGLVPLFLTLGMGCTPHATGVTSKPLPSLLDLTIPVYSHVKADVLFMVDNSPSMNFMQAELIQRFGVLLDGLGVTGRGGPIDLHVGVVTSDYGAGAVDDTMGGCQASPGGQRGVLQAIGAAAAAGCKAPVGAPFISYRRDADGTVTTNLPSGQDLEATFTCMASVGTNGCGFEHQLESVYAALHDTTNNAGFMREGSQLVVVFLTNEDDGSAPPTAMIYSPDPALVSLYGPLDTYRQTRFGIACGDPLALPPEGDSMGPLAGCVPAPSQLGGEYDVARYIDYFTRSVFQGGVKIDPGWVTLIGIEPPSMPVQTALVERSSLATPYVPCASPSVDCVPRVLHSCQNNAKPGFFGDPALRLERVISSAASHLLISICGPDADATPSYASAMSLTAQTMTQQLGGTCVSSPLVHPSQPSCSVSVAHASGVAEAVPSCTARSALCWTVTADATCRALENPETQATQQARLVVNGLLPTDTVTATCRAYATQP